MTQVTKNHMTPAYKGIVNQAANEICRRGFRVPALIALESGPLLPILGSQLLWVAQPALSLLIPSHKIRQTAELLETPEALSILIEYLREDDNSRVY